MPKSMYKNKKGNSGSGKVITPSNNPKVTKGGYAPGSQNTPRGKSRISKGSKSTAQGTHQNSGPDRGY